LLKLWVVPMAIMVFLLAILFEIARIWIDPARNWFGRHVLCLKSVRNKDDPRRFIIGLMRNNLDPFGFYNEVARNKACRVAINVVRRATNAFPVRFNVVRQRKYLDPRDLLNGCLRNKVEVCRKNHKRQRNNPGLARNKVGTQPNNLGLARPKAWTQRNNLLMQSIRIGMLRKKAGRRRKKVWRHANKLAKRAI
jgi:hypothetical protein